MRVAPPLETMHHSDRSPHTLCDGSKGFVRVFSDEFEGSRGLNTSTWQVVHGWSARTHSMTADAWGHTDNVYVEDGALVLRTRWPTDAEKRVHPDATVFTGAVTSRALHTFAPGRLCISARLPGRASAGGGGPNQGLWPAHWLMPSHANDFDDSLGCWPDLGEIDLMEMVNGEPSWYGTYHWNSKRHHPADAHDEQRCSVVTPGGGGGHAEVQRCAPLERWDSEWNEYAVEWDGETHVSFYVNGVLLGTATAGVTPPSTAHEGASAATDRPAFYDDPMFLMLQTAVGGSWPGAVSASTDLPTFHRIDYVRYERYV